jgi:predicted transcriptional regulator
MKPVKVGIMPLEQYKRYTIGIARGQIKPKKSDPKIWFDTIETCMQVLSTHNLNLLKLIDEKKKPSRSRSLPESPAGKRAICRAP